VAFFRRPGTSSLPRGFPAFIVPLAIDFGRCRENGLQSTLAVNLAGALALNASTTLIDEDPLQSCYQWAQRNGRLPMPVLLPEEARSSDLDRCTR
jgi:hypothetical protein